MTKTEIDAEQALGEPVLAEFSDELRRTKRTLLLVSTVTIFAYLSGVRITRAGFLGVEFSNPDQISLWLGVLSVVIYLSLQFAWQVSDYLHQTRIRITGSNVRYIMVGRFSSEMKDYPDDPKQSSLYNWWRERANDIGNFREVVENLDSVADRLTQLAKGPTNFDLPNINHVTRASSEIKNDASKLIKAIEKHSETLSSVRIPVSLKRFDAWFGRFKKSQVNRLFVLDVGFPAVVAVFSIICAICGLVAALPSE